MGSEMGIILSRANIPSTIIYLVVSFFPTMVIFFFAKLFDDPLKCDTHTKAIPKNFWLKAYEVCPEKVHHC